MRLVIRLSPVLALLLLTALAGGRWSLPFLSQSAGSILLLLAFLGGVFWLFGWIRIQEETQRHEQQGHRFLCPYCLHFGVFRHGCGNCGLEVHPWTAETAGWGENTCRTCGKPLFARGTRRGCGVLARCLHCGGSCDPARHHERRVRVVATPCRADFETFCRTANQGWTRHATYALHDDGSVLTFVLDLESGELAEGRNPLQHASAHLNALWIGPTAKNPLRLGEALDGLLRMPTQQFSTECLRVLVGPGPVTPAARNVLATRMTRVEYDIPAERVPSVLATPPASDQDEQVLAVLTEEDLTALTGITDRNGRSILGKHDRYRNRLDREVRVVCLERAEAAPEASALREPFRRVEAVWIQRLPEDPQALETLLQRFFRVAGSDASRLEQVTVCLEGLHPHPALTALLESRFGSLQAGVPAREFLGEGPRAKGWLHAGTAPVRTLAVLCAPDLWALSRCMEPRHRHDLGGGWLCEAAPDRLNYVVNLDDPERRPSSFFATPDLSEVEAVWLHLAATEPLALGESLDRVVRLAGLSGARFEEVIFCVSHSDPDPAVRNVLEARLGQVRYGVAPESFLGSLGILRPRAEEPVPTGEEQECRQPTEWETAGSAAGHPPDEVIPPHTLLAGRAE